MATERHSEAGQPRASGSSPRPPAGGQPDFPPGTHLVTSRRGYLHHGIYVGDSRVVHYSGLCGAWRRGPVQEVTLEQFAAGRSLLIKPVAGARYCGTEVVARARSRLGEDCYRLTSNNCEHFCEWCIHGEPRSEQIDSLFDDVPLALRRWIARFCRRAAAGPAERPAGGQCVA